MIRKILNCITGALLLSCTVACDSDLENIYVQPGSDMTLGGADGDIILSADHPDALVLTVYWTADGELTLDNPAYKAPVNAAEQTLQLASDADFSSPLDIAVDADTRSRQFLNDELNALLGRLDFVPNISAPLYIRVRSLLAANTDPAYSNTLVVNVQPYKIAMNIGRVLNSDMSETSMTLASPMEDGIYTGFMGVPGWYNWYFREASNVVWGNLGQDGHIFYASSADDHWNFWFPEPAGCYYVTLNTIEGWWSGLHIDRLAVSGDVTGEMEYNQKTNQWTLTVNSGSARTANVSISGTGSLYNKDTGDMGPALERTVGFVGTSEALTFSEAASPVVVDLPAGETTLILDLTDPMQWRLYPGEAAVAPEPDIDPVLYISGFNDGITGGWDLESYLTLYDEASASYAAVQQGNSLWGWLIYHDQDWGGVTGLDSGDAYSGSLKEGGGNIPAPAAGRYLINVSLSGMTYSLAEVTDVWYTGLNDDWSIYPMTLVEDCIYQAEVQKTADTPWGVKILLRDDWSMWFGGGGGTLRYGQDGFDGDNDLPNGTYILTVDLSRGTYTYTAK